MKTWSIKNAGKIQFEIMDDFGKDSQAIETLLKYIINGIAKRAVIYYNKIDKCDHVFLNSEGELHSTITLSIADLVDTFKTEFPVWRKYSKTKSGSLDYWIFYKNIIFALELKLEHKGIGRYNCRSSRRIFNGFNTAIEQLEGIENNQKLFFIKDAKGLVKIVFETIVFSTKSKNIHDDYNDNIEEYNKKINDSFNDLVDIGRHQIDNKLRFNKKVNFRSLWFLDKNITYLKKGREEYDLLIPAVGYIGNIDYYVSK